VAESEPVAVLTNGNPTGDLALTLLVELDPAEEATPEPEATLEATPEATPVSEAETESNAATTISGTVGYNERSALPAGSVVQVQLLNLATTPFSVVAEDRIVTTGEQPPFDFALPLAEIDSGDLGAYAIAASITAEGETLWSAPGLTPLLVGGTQRTAVDLTLQSGENGGSAMPSAPDASGAGALGGAAVGGQPTAEPANTALLETLGSDVVGVIVRFGTPASQGPGTEVRVELRDVTASAILAEATADASNSDEPIFVRLPYAAGDVNPGNEYRVFVTVLEDGVPVGFTGRGSPVLTNGAPNAVEIVLP
jgi:putative lipoprotein